MVGFTRSGLGEPGPGDGGDANHQDDALARIIRQALKFLGDDGRKLVGLRRFLQRDQQLLIGRANFVEPLFGSHPLKARSRHILEQALY